MVYANKMSFDDFKGHVERSEKYKENPKAYNEFIGKLGLGIRDHFFPETSAEEKDRHWPKWVAAIIDHVGSEQDRKSIEKIDTKKFSDYVQKAGAGKEIYGLLVHYRLHRYHEDRDRKFADAIDTWVFDKPIVQKYGAVFVYSPDEVLYLNPSAPFLPPPHRSKKHVDELLAENSDDSIWLDPHNHHSIPLNGREEEMKRLTAFMDHSGLFRICPVIGPSGSGKTRMVSEWMKPYILTEETEKNPNPKNRWQAGFVVSNSSSNARDPVPWRNWIIDRNTLGPVDKRDSHFG